MTRPIVTAFFLLASLFVSPAYAQDTMTQDQLRAAVPQQSPGMHTLESQVPAEPLTHQLKSDAPVQNSAFDNLHQHFVNEPSQMPQTDVHISHMGQSILDQQIIHEPGLDGLQPAATSSTTFGVISASPPPAPPAPKLPGAGISPAARNADFSEMRQGDTAVIGQVIDPLRIRMLDGRIIQLSGIEIPDLDPYDPGPVSLAARDLLKQLLEGQQARLYVTKDASSGRVSRMGDILAHLQTRDGGYWVQGVLLAAGLARVRPSARNTEMATQMMKLEEIARAGKRGLWSDPRYAVLTPDTAARGENGWAIVEGTIYSASINRNIVYLDFGADWHTDFTIAVNTEVRRALQAQGIDPLALSGKHVRVRGWLRDYNGPFMDLENPVWLQIIAGPMQAAAPPGPSGGEDNNGNASSLAAGTPVFMPDNNGAPPDGGPQLAPAAGGNGAVAGPIPIPAMQHY